MEITGARTCLQLSLSCSLRATRNPPMTCKLWPGTALAAERRITPFPCQRLDEPPARHDGGREWISACGWWEACWPHGGPAQLGRDPPSHRALNLFGAHFQTARFFEFFTGGM
jgi:hypothetical protein